MNVYEDLKLYGYSLVPNVIMLEVIIKIRTHLDRLINEDRENDELLSDTEDQTIIRSVFKKDPSLFLSLFEHDSIKNTCAEVFPDGFTLQSMNASLAKPNSSNNGIGVHIDSKYPSKGIENVTSLGIAFCVDDFTKFNGATLIWPFSHLSGVNPRSLVSNGSSLPQPNVIEAKSGDAIIFLSQTWHSVGLNQTAENRWGIFSFINPWWIKPTWDYRDCGVEAFNSLNQFQKEILGFYTQTPAISSKRNYTKINPDDLPDCYEEARNFIY